MSVSGVQVNQQQVVRVAGERGIAGRDAEVPSLVCPFLGAEDKDVLRAVDGPARKAADVDDLDVAIQAPLLCITSECGRHDHDGQCSSHDVPGFGQDAPPR